MQHVSRAGLFVDSKHFVDCPLNRPWEEVAHDWECLSAAGITVAGLETFIFANFGDPGSDLKMVLPPGWHEEAPLWVEGVQDPGLRAFGITVRGLWKTLCRQVCPLVLAHPDRHTLLPLPHPFIMPGDRFRECYNWDSYWVIRGLLASGLRPAAEQLLRNLLHLVDVWGFVPNGARSYYTNRSQPPLLSAMVRTVWGAGAYDGGGDGEGGGGGGDGGGGGGGGDEVMLAEALPRLVAQHRYWTTGLKAVRVRGSGSGSASGSAGGIGGCGDGGGNGDHGDGDGGGVTDFQLSRYHVDLYEPRPESFREDVHLADSAGLNPQQTAALYCDIASAAESGWDFSTRWFVGGGSLEFTRTTQIIPADLNAWLYRTERDIAAIAARLGDTATQSAFDLLATERLRAMDALMWSQSDGCWHDLLLLPPAVAQVDAAGAWSKGGDGSASVSAATSASSDVAAAGEEVFGAEQRPGVYASNWVPLWCGCAPRGGPQAAAAVAGLQASGLLQEGGLLTSLYQSGQQWDAPNAWPPLVHMAVEGLAESGVEGAAAAAAVLAERWVHANRVAWDATGHMHEKYDGYVPGGVGGGGEYVPQVGFGWSNGVVLALMQRYCCAGVKAVDEGDSSCCSGGVAA